MEKPYVEQVEGGYRLTGSRVSLDSVVYAFWRGESAESIAQSFPALTLEQVYGALTFYLAHRAEVDAHLETAEAELAVLREQSRRRDPRFFQRLIEARRMVA